MSGINQFINYSFCGYHCKMYLERRFQISIDSRNVFLSLSYALGGLEEIEEFLKILGTHNHLSPQL